jgi:hypothetical protein
MSPPTTTTFHFVNDGMESALDQAREAAGARDVRIAGGGATILEYVNAGLIDEFSIALSPVLFGSGIRLFEGVDAGPRGPGSGPFGADAAGDPPDLRSPGAVGARWTRKNTVSTTDMDTSGERYGFLLGGPGIFRLEWRKGAGLSGIQALNGRGRQGRRQLE